jgi:succinoglycan biosynthesis transport protein ExoP
MLNKEQSPDDSSMTSRQLDVEDYGNILRRNKGWIAGPAFAALVFSVVIVFLWPDTYISVATIRVAPPQVPESFVPANTNQDVQGRVNALVQLILNRATLTNIINTHGLYKNKLARMPLDDVIEDMKLNDIQVLPLRQSFNAGQRETQYPAFEIRYAYSERFTAQKVATDLVARFLEENIREVSQQTVSTTQFLQDRWEESKKKLDELEQRLSIFRTQHIGRLPEEQQNNYQQLAAFRAQKLNLNLSMNRVNQERLLFENQLRILRDQLASLRDSNTPEQAAQRSDERLTEQDHEIAQYEESLATARERYKESHPDVQRLVNLLAVARGRRQAILKQDSAGKPETGKPDDPVASLPAHQLTDSEPGFPATTTQQLWSGLPAHPSTDSDPGFPATTTQEHRSGLPASAQFLREQRELDADGERTKGLILAKGVEMEDYRKQSVQLDGTIGNYEARIESTPVGIREYDELIRDRDLAKKDYEALDGRVNSSALSTALQNRQQGERLEQLDPPSLPQTPAHPKREVTVAVGTSLGLLLGLCLAGLREMHTGALKSVKDVSAYSHLPILGSIPMFEAPGVARRRKRTAWLAWSATSLAGVAIMSASVAHYYIGRL